MNVGFSFDNIDQIYIINLRDRPDRREHMLKIMNYFGFTNFMFIDAINTKHPYYAHKYDFILKRLASLYTESEFELFKKWSFQPGAYGCIKSHNIAIKDAIKNNYKHILILEDDVTCKKSLLKDFIDAMIDVPKDWEFLYLGKKQGQIVLPYDIKINNYSELRCITP